MKNYIISITPWGKLHDKTYKAHVWYTVNTTYQINYKPLCNQDRHMAIEARLVGTRDHKLCKRCQAIVKKENLMSQIVASQLK